MQPISTLTTTRHVQYRDHKLDYSSAVVVVSAVLVSNQGYQGKPTAIKLVV